jgi:hypothetical protein
LGRGTTIKLYLPRYTGPLATRVDISAAVTEAH